MYDRVRLDWFVPQREWQQFRDYVEDEFGSISGYLGREAEAAMREYADADGYNGIEERIDRLVEAAGSRPSAASKEKKSELANEETTRVTVKVESEVKDKFRTTTAESENSFGVEFARAIRSYRDGGRAARLERKLDRVLDDAAGLLAEASDSSSDDSLSAVERKTIAIANELGDEFTDDDLEQEIVETGGLDSAPSIEKYRRLVTEKLEVEPHPTRNDLWIPAERAKNLVPGQPRECRQPVDRLNKSEKVRRIRLAVGRRAASRDNGKVRIETGKIKDSVLNGKVSKASVLDLMRSASAIDGISVDDSRQTAALKVDLELIKEDDPDLFHDIIEYRDESESGLVSGSISATIDDYNEESEDEDGPITKADASKEMDSVLQGARTDGGKPEE